MKILALVGAATIGLTAFGSTIQTSSTTASGGSSYTVSINNFATTGNDMAGIQITAFVNGVNEGSCTWATGSTSGCTVDNVSLTFPGGTSTDPAAGGAGAIWTVTNNSGGNLTELVINAVVGDTDFDLCTFGGSNTVDFTDSGTHGSYCTGGTGGNAASVGTTGSNYGYSVIGASGGTSSAIGTAAYSESLHLNAQLPVGDLWGMLTLTFPSSGTTFSNGQTFQFYADTDTLTSATLNGVPEPASLGLIGAGLAGLAFMKRRRRA